MKKTKIFIMFAFILVFVLVISIIIKKRNNEIKHVFLITIDTLRADHLSCYGYPVKTTPFIDSLAKNGIFFKNAFSQSASTCPSHASIMTGLYPSEHRVIANGYILDDSYTTLAEILKEKGFKTAAFTSTDRHFLASNIDQGFEMYEEPLDTVKTYGYKYRPARLTINNAILWLDNFNVNRKLFLWIHLFDPHLPYHPPEKYKEIIRKQLSKEFLEKFVKKANVNLEIFDNSFGKYYEHILNYDAEIRYVDDELKRFFGYIKNKGLYKNSLFIITGDHGEGLGQHDWLQHATQIYQEEIHVPLVFYFGGIKRKIVKVIDDPVENFDIFSTVLDLLEIGNFKEKVSSISLRKKIFENKKVRKYVFTERQFYKKRKIYKKKLPFWKKMWEKGIKVSIQDKHFKYIYRSAFKDEFFNLKKDPYELKNIKDSNEKIAIRYKKKILKILSNFKKTKVRKVNKKIIKRLKSLGYVE